MKINKLLFFIPVLLGVVGCNDTPQDESVKVNGVNLSNYQIVYAKDAEGYEETLAKKMREAIKKELGLKLIIKTDEEEKSKYELRVGLTNRDEKPNLDDGKYLVKTIEDSILFYGKDTNGLINAVESMITPLVYTKTVKDVDYSNEVISEVKDKSLSVMSYNVRVGLGATEDKPRPERVLTLIKDVKPDVFGVQEASPTWMNYFKTGAGSVSGISDEYNFVGWGRDGKTSGEYSAVFYNTSKFKVIEGATKWLSDTPDKIGSKFADSAYPRICSYAVLERLSDGLKFVYFNTHLDHMGGHSKYEQVRINQAKVLMNIASNYEDYPIFVTGDFNDFSGAVRDSFIAEGYDYTQDAATNTEIHHTYPTPLYPGDANSDKIIIDYCFAKGSNYIIDKYDVLTEDVLGGPTSDHYPLLNDFYLHEPFQKGSNVVSISIDENFELNEGMKLDELNIPVIAEYDDGKVKTLPSASYKVDAGEGVVAFGGEYEINVSLLSNPDIKTSKTFKCDKVFKAAEDLTLAGTNVRVTSETKYQCNEDGTIHTAIGGTTMVKGMDNCATKHGGGTMSFSVNVAKAGKYKLIISSANLYITKSGSGYISNDLYFGDVLTASVNSSPLDISNVLLPGHKNLNTETNALSVLARCFHEYELGVIDLIAGENSFSFKGRSDCNYRNNYSEVPVPNTEYFKLIQA